MCWERLTKRYDRHRFRLAKARSAKPTNGTRTDFLLTQFLQEVWILYGIGTLILVLRHVIRARSVGFKGLQGDDYFAMLVLALYTIDAVTVHNVCKYMFNTLDSPNFLWLTPIKTTWQQTSRDP